MVSGTVVRQPQWQDALDVGNRVRVAQANLKVEIAGLPQGEGLAVVAELLESGDLGVVGGMRVESLLVAVRGVGRGKVGRLLVSAGCSGSRRVRELTERQRLAIAVSLRAYGVD